MRKIYFILTLLFCFHLSVYGSEEGAKILYLKGKGVSGPPEGPFSPIDKATKIPIGHIVETKKDSLILMSIADVVKVKLNELSRLKIEPPKKNAQGKKERNLFLELGNAFVDVFTKKLKNKNEALRVRTKTVAMGVRGTQFFAALAKSPKKVLKKDVWMCVKKGEVIVQSLKDGKEVSVKKGEGVVVPSGEGISAPKALPWTSNLNWSMDIKEDMVNKVPIEQAYYDLLNVDYD